MKNCLTIVKQIIKMAYRRKNKGGNHGDNTPKPANQTK